MATVRLDLETITPLLMYGADQEVPELRGPSFRGSVRYWLRAVLGNRHPYPDDLYNVESAILGSTAQGSAVSIRAQQSKNMEAVREQRVLPESTSRGWRPRYTAFPAGDRFRLTLSTHPLDQSDVLTPDSPLAHALLLLINFGGLGRRARRGSGNLRLLKAGGNRKAAVERSTRPANRDELKTLLVDIATHAGGETPVGRRPSFPIFAPDTVVVLLGTQRYRDHEEAFDNRSALWQVSGPYHHSGGIFGDVRPRRSSAIHMRVGYTDEGLYAQQTIFYSGNGRWGDMQRYISECENKGFERIYGSAEGWS